MGDLKSISEFKFKGEPLDQETMRQNLLAPNGKKSNLQRKQYDVVRSREFKQWFGDWENDPENASKVLDENGEPLAVYHGTPSYGFDIFMNTYDLPRATENETNDLGFWFTNSHETAREFMFDSSGGGVYKVFINLRNPKIFTTTKLNQAELDRLRDLIDSLEVEKMRLGRSINDMGQEKRKKYHEITQAISDAWDQWTVAKKNDSFEHFMNYRDKYAEYGDNIKKGKVGAWIQRFINTNKNEANKKLVHELKSGSHDGIVIADTKYDAKKGTINQYVVFDANNIKSITNNNFNPDSANIHENESKTAGEGIYTKMSNLNINMMEENKNNEENLELGQNEIPATENGSTENVENPAVEGPGSIEEMDTFNVTKRRLKTFSQFISGAKKIAKTDKKEHEIVADNYSGEKTGKKGVETLDTRKEKKGEHDTVKAAYSGDKKGAAGRETLDEQ